MQGAKKIDTKYFRNIAKTICDKQVNVYLDKIPYIEGALKEEHNTEEALGQEICFEISDLFHAFTCLEEKICLFTSDKDLVTLCKHLKIHTFICDVKDMKIKTI